MVYGLTPWSQYQYSRGRQESQQIASEHFLLHSVHIRTPPSMGRTNLIDCSWSTTAIDNAVCTSGTQHVEGPNRTDVSTVNQQTCELARVSCSAESEEPAKSDHSKIPPPGRGAVDVSNSSPHVTGFDVLRDSIRSASGKAVKAVEFVRFQCCIATDSTASDADLHSEAHAGFVRGL